MKFVILTLLFVCSIPSFAAEVCRDHLNQLKFVFNSDSHGQLKSVDFYEKGNLVFTDSGKKPLGFLKNICHVNGSTINGQLVIIGQCTSFDRDNNPKQLTIIETGESFDLREFDCSFENSSVSTFNLFQLSEKPKCYNKCFCFNYPDKCTLNIPTCPSTGSCH